MYRYCIALYRTDEQTVEEGDNEEVLEEEEGEFEPKEKVILTKVKHKRQTGSLPWRSQTAQTLLRKIPRRFMTGVKVYGMYTFTHYIH